MNRKSSSPTIALKDVSFLNGLSASELAFLQKALKEQSFEKGEILFFEGNSCDRIFIVRSGRIKVFRTSSSGKEQILEILNPGDTCACNPGQPTWSCSSSSQALTDCSVWYLPRHEYVQLMKTNSKFVQSLNRLFAQRLCRFCSLIEQVSLNDVKKRLVRFLLDMLEDGDRSVKSDTLLIPFTREEISQRIGSSRETVARYLHQLKREGLIDVKPNKIIIRDKEELEKILL